MKLDIHLREVETGFSRVYEDDYEWNDEFSDYIWADGNYSCDCNRAYFLFDWGRADNGNYSSYADCSDNRIVIDKIVNHDTGEVLAEDL